MAADAGTETLMVLGATRGAAEESTFRRAFAAVDADRLDAVLGAWLWTRTAHVTGRLVIAIDGKTVRGARTKNTTAPHLVAALAHGTGAVLGQVAVAAKSNEIPAVPTLLKAFTDLTGAVLTMDAMHTQTDTAELIITRGADYVMTIKANMPTLYKRLKQLPLGRHPLHHHRHQRPRPPGPAHDQNRIRRPGPDRPTTAHRHGHPAQHRHQPPTTDRRR